MAERRDFLKRAAGAAATVLAGGCDFLAVTDEQLVKNRIREHALAITNRDWTAAAASYDSTIQWQQGNRVLKGRSAVQGFLATINEMHNMDEFFIIVHSAKKARDDLIDCNVTMQAHIVLSSTQLDFTNRFWEARMGWVKRGPGKWLIAYIVETTPRKEGQFSRV